MIIGAGGFCISSGSGSIPCTVTASTLTPSPFTTVTLTCDQAGRATYNWRVMSNLASLRTQNVFSFSGQSIQFRPIYDGTWTVELTVTDGSGGVGRATLTLTVTNGVRYCEMTVNTAPPGAAVYSFNQQANLSPFKQIDGLYGNHPNAYHANRQLVNGGIITRLFNGYARVGLSPTITWAGSIIQNNDPDWDHQVGGYANNNNLGRSDNGSNVTFSSPLRRVEDWYWFRMDRDSGGTVRLYVLNEIRINSFERYIMNQLDWTLLHTYSLTNTNPLYIRQYFQTGLGYDLYMYGETE